MCNRFCHALPRLSRCLFLFFVLKTFLPCSFYFLTFHRLIFCLLHPPPNIASSNLFFSAPVPDALPFFSTFQQQLQQQRISSELMSCRPHNEDVQCLTLLE
ncbi:hypothetical protein GOODEAATRI_018743 [Goodea atripinnis]|uniref:Secreted protein n=1 Tax=Goodea atripinnis TaxID=208336 RepID=A0ABV0PZK4_9TELE